MVFLEKKKNVSKLLTLHFGVGKNFSVHIKSEILNFTRFCVILMKTNKVVNPAENEILKTELGSQNG